MLIEKKIIILSPWLRNWNTDFTLENWLFGSVKLTKNANLYKYKYSGFGIWFDARSEFSFTDGRVGKNIKIFGAGKSLSVHIDNKNKDILIIGEGPTQGLDDTVLTAEAKYPINFTQFLICWCYKNISALNKILWNKKLYTMFR